MEGTLTRMVAPSAEPHEIHMDRKIAHRIEMEVARNHTVLLASRSMS